MCKKATLAKIMNIAIDILHKSNINVQLCNKDQIFLRPHCRYDTPFCALLKTCI